MSMIKRVQHRPSTWLILVLVASMLTCVVVLLSAASAPITWTPAAVTATLTPGASTTRTVSFTSSQTFNDVTVRIVPALQPFVQVAPTSLSTITKGQPTTLTLTMAVPASALPGTVTGTIQLRTGSGPQGYNLAPPLQVTITVLRGGNTPPVAYAGPDQTVFVGQTVTLDGSQSTDIDGDPLQYRWSLLVPTGSQATLADPTVVQTPFTVDVPGTYFAQLIVNDGLVDSAPDTVTITTQNSRPVANAGPDQTVFVGDTVHLNGSKSSDVDGDLLTYAWSFGSRPDGSGATLSDPLTVTPTFVVDLPGTYAVQLIVNDGALASAADTVSITTQSSRPVANAGPDQTVLVGRTVTLDGSASHDADGDPLHYHWSLSTAPAGSTAILSDPSAVQPSFQVDLPGTYVAQLIVDDDGPLASDPDTVMISTENSKPVANAGADQTVAVGATVHLDGSASSDADGDDLLYSWTLIARPTDSTATLTDATTAQPSFVVDKPGTYVAQLIVDDGQLASDPDTAMIVAVDTRPPDLRLDPPDGMALNTAMPVLTITYQDDESGVDLGSLRVQLDGADVTTRFAITATNAAYQAALTDGPHSLSATIKDQAGNTAQATAQFTIDTVPPDAVNQVLLTVEPVTNGQTTVSGAAGSVEPNARVRLRNTRTGQTVTVSATAIGSFTAMLLAQSGDSVTITILDAAGNTSAPTTATVVGTLPPDPATVAPPLDQSVVTSLLAATAFLYTGPNPIQTGVAPGTIEARRAAVVRGKVTDRSGAPLPGVQVTVLNHPEFGQTLTRADGMLDLVVNGGGLLTIDYTMAGYLPAQRQVNAPWQDYVRAPDVALIPLDTNVTTIVANASTTQVHRSTVSTDSDGSRRATLLFPAGTTATMVMANGTTQPLTNLNVRASEYTVGANGPMAMPGELPPTSGYTYAVELSVDQAVAAKAVKVTFNQPIPTYVENFLGFPVGEAVPVGYYDRSAGVWVPADNGRVIKITAINGGIATVDTVGTSGLPPVVLDSTELQSLASLYSVGQELWRTPVSHFSPWDCNLAFIVPANADKPDQDPESDPLLENSCTVSGNSIVECQNQLLGETIGVAGTSFGLQYQSARVPGYKAPYKLEIPLSGATLPGPVVQIELEIQIAGRYVRQSFPPLPNQQTTFTWDGKDVYGRTVQGNQLIIVRTGYPYDAVYQRTPRFGYNGNGVITASRSRQQVTLWRPWWKGTVGSWDARAHGLGGWSLSVHHAYDPVDRVLHRGDGSRQKTASGFGPTIRTFAGPGVVALGNNTIACYSGEDVVALGAQVCAVGLATGPDGSVYIADFANRVRKVAPNGRLTTVAGTGTACSGPCGNDGPATQAQLWSPGWVAVGLDGSVYISERNRVRKVAPDGIITTLAGTGTSGFSGDGGPANLAQLSDPRGVTVGPDGSVYIADASNRRIRRVTPDGIIATVAGNGAACAATAACGDGGAATLAQVLAPQGLAVGRDGSLYMADTGLNRIRQVTPDGIIRTIAGTGVAGFSGDGGGAIFARLQGASHIALGTDDTVFVADVFNNRVRWFRPGGTINTLAGTGASGRTGDGGLALQAQLKNPGGGIAVGPDDSVYFGQLPTGDVDMRVRRIAPLSAQVGAAGTLVPAVDGSEVYVFTAGRHVQTLDAITGALRYQFAYDSAGRLSAVTDGDGNVTMMQRDGSGKPTAIVGPFGQSTALAVNPDGFLSHVTSPAGENISVAYTTDGLLTGLTNPRSHVSTYTFDNKGRLTSATDPIGAIKTFTRAGTTKDYTVTLTTALGRVTTYRVESLSNGSERRTTTDSAGKQSQLVMAQNGNLTATYPDGTAVTVVLGPDPRWGMRAPVTMSEVVTTSGGKAHTTTTQRTATLTDSTNVLSLATMNQTVTINGRAFTTAYNAASRTFTQTTPKGRQTTTVVDLLGKPVQAQYDGLAARSFTYDLQGRLVSATQGSGADSRTTTLAYGVNGFLQSVTDAASRTSTFVRDANGRTTDLAFPDGGLAHFTYDANGNVTTLTPPGRPDHRFAYTQNNQVSAYTAPVVGAQNSQTLSTYNADRQPLQVDRPDGQSVAVHYDSAGRPSLVDMTVGDTLYDYDAAGRLATVNRDPGANLTYAYDGGLPIGTTWNGPIAGSVTRAYDNNFRVTSLSVNGANPIALTYDLDSLPLQVGALTLTRNAPNGFITSTALGAITDTMTYDVFGAPAVYTVSQNGSVIYSTTYTRDALGRIASQSETIGGIAYTFAYTYDLAGRLTDVHQDNVLTASYSYDGNGNRLSRTDGGGTLTATYDAQDRLEQFGTTTYVHNAAGERQSKTAAGQTTSYQYDTLGNLTGVTLPGAMQIEYLLDGGHRRVGKKRNGALVQGFLYQDGLRPIAELDDSNNVVSRFVYANGINVPAYMLKAGVTYRLVTDHLGSPRLVIDAATGSMAQRLDYDEFGNVILDTNPGFQPFGFAGGLYDPETQLVRFGARTYDAETGRWTTKDPIGFGRRANLYDYAANNPVNLIDPLGNDPVDPLASTGVGPLVQTFEGPSPKSVMDANIARAASQAAAQAESARVQAYIRAENRTFYKTPDAKLFNGSTFSDRSIPFGTNEMSGEIGGDRRINLDRCPTTLPHLTIRRWHTRGALWVGCSGFGVSRGSRANRVGRARYRFLIRRRAISTN